MISGIIIHVPIPSASMRGNKRGHSRDQGREVKWVRAEAKMLATSALAGETVAGDPAMTRITYVVRLGKGDRRMDDDNLIAGMKATRDGIADALSVKDSLWVTQPVEFTKNMELQGAVVVCVYWGAL